MALLNQSVQVYGKLNQLFEKLLEGQAPEKYTREFLRDLGFRSSNWHATIALFKGLGFLSPDGIPTSRYMEFLDKTKWKIVLAEAVKEAYGDIFVMKRNPESADVNMIAGKYKSTYNLSDNAADRAARTFLALLTLCDEDVISNRRVTPDSQLPEEGGLSQKPPPNVVDKDDSVQRSPEGRSLGLNYNIQIHLPATKDVEVYNAIFKSLREQIID